MKMDVSIRSNIHFGRPHHANPHLMKNKEKPLAYPSLGGQGRLFAVSPD